MKPILLNRILLFTAFATINGCSKDQSSSGTSPLEILLTPKVPFSAPSWFSNAPELVTSAAFVAGGNVQCKISEPNADSFLRSNHVKARYELFSMLDDEEKIQTVETTDGSAIANFAVGAVGTILKCRVTFMVDGNEFISENSSEKTVPALAAIVTPTPIASSGNFSNSSGALEVVSFKVVDATSELEGYSDALEVKARFVATGASGFCVKTTPQIPEASDTCFKQDSEQTIQISENSVTNVYGWAKGAQWQISNRFDATIRHQVFNDFAGVSSLSTSAPVGGRHIKVSWTPVNHPLQFDRYHIYVTTNEFDFSTPYRVVFGGSRSSYVIGGLEDSTTYRIAVRASNGTVEEKNEQEISIATLPAMIDAGSLVPTNEYFAARNRYTSHTKDTIDVGEIVTIAGVYESVLDKGNFDMARDDFMYAPFGVVQASDGTLYVSEMNDYYHQIFRIDSTGRRSLFAGLGQAALEGDGGSATLAKISYPYGLALGSDNSLFVAAYGNHAVRKVTSDGIISRVAGTGTGGFDGDGGLAAESAINAPIAVALDSIGNVYLAEYGGHRVRKVATNGIISTFAGNGVATSSGDGGPATIASIKNPYGLAFDSQGNLYISEAGTHKIRKVNSAGVISTFAGIGVAGADGDGGAATSANLSSPTGIAFDSEGSLFIAETGTDKIRRIKTNGIISTVVGTGVGGVSGDVADPLSTALLNPYQISPDNEDGILFVDRGNRVVRRLSSDNRLSIVVGHAPQPYSGIEPDGTPGTVVRLNAPRISEASNGEVYIADYGNGVVRKLRSDGTMVTIAGTGVAGFSGDGGPATAAKLNGPLSAVTDSLGNIYISDYSNHRIRKVSTDGTISTYAGEGVAGFTGDGGPATSARLNRPYNLKFSPKGELHFSDNYNDRIRKINSLGVISTVVGTGSNGLSGDGGPATSANIDGPIGFDFDEQGNLVFADSGHKVIRRVTTDGLIYSLTSPTDTEIYENDFSHKIYVGTPYFVGVSSGGEIYFTTGYNPVIRKISNSGYVTTVTGATREYGFSGDGGPASAARVFAPYSVIFDENGNLIFSDGVTQRVRLIKNSN